ncbi:hypothetical protein VCR5J5_750020 [Vibrio crassostreae]|uniref:Uncharacterized protein n=1 Tax=Vibrio crassostreae TaxID=246167 RepID=A0A822N449_9VIBR|nr:hypothetical protein VCR5J5_750020 [Vibrio crassostreae]
MMSLLKHATNCLRQVIQTIVSRNNNTYFSHNDALRFIRYMANFACSMPRAPCDKITSRSAPYVPIPKMTTKHNRSKNLQPQFDFQFEKTDYFWVGNLQETIEMPAKATI